MAEPAAIRVPVRVVADLPMAWRHHCGTLNEGAHKGGSVCAGCRCDARSSEVEARYLLVEMSGDA